MIDCTLFIPNCDLAGTMQPLGVLLLMGVLKDQLQNHVACSNLQNSICQIAVDVDEPVVAVPTCLD